MILAGLLVCARGERTDDDCAIRVYIEGDAAAAHGQTDHAGGGSPAPRLIRRAIPAVADITDHNRAVGVHPQRLRDLRTAAGRTNINHTSFRRPTHSPGWITVRNYYLRQTADDHLSVNADFVNPANTEG